MNSAAPQLIYVWGSGGSGQLGLGDTEDHALPQQLRSPEITLRPESVSSGGCHSAGIHSETGELYLWGDNERQQLGEEAIEGALTYRVAPNEPLVGLPSDSNLRLVACGWWNTLIAARTTSADDETRTGDLVYSCGSNDSKQLGRSSDLTLLAPVQGLPCQLRVSSLSCGWKHALLACDDGAVFSWGTGRHGQLGLGDTSLVVEHPQRVSTLDNLRIRRVRCGWEHSVFLDASGLVYTCGSNRHGQLGVPSAAKRQSLPIQVRVEDPGSRSESQPLIASQIDCGWHFVLGLTADTGKLVSWGKGSHGQLGLGTVDNQKSPRFVEFPGESVKQIACGSEHMLVAMTNGILFSCGWGEHGNLGHGDKTNRLRLEQVTYFEEQRLKVVAVAAGGAVSIARATAI